VREVRGWEQVEAAQAAGRGVIFLSPHLGAWELGSLYMARHYPVTALYRPLRVPGLDALVRAARERTGATLMPTDASGVRSLYRALERGETVGILPDQEPGSGGGIFAPFFGHPANTMVLVSRLASRSGAVVLFCVPERLPRGRGFRLNFTPAPAAVSAADLNRSVAAMNAGVEAWVRRLPAQYLWSYKRFKSRPEGEPRWY
jgi:KDO2-lipid IV(A) lauroyltransferase